MPSHWLNQCAARAMWHNGCSSGHFVCEWNDQFLLFEWIKLVEVVCCFVSRSFVLIDAWKSKTTNSSHRKIIAWEMRNDRGISKWEWKTKNEHPFGDWHATYATCNNGPSSPLNIRQHQKYLYDYHLGFRRMVSLSSGTGRPTACHLLWISGHCRRHDVATVMIVVGHPNDAYDVRTFDYHCYRFPANNNHWPPNYFVPIPIPIWYPSWDSCDAVAAPGHSNVPNVDDSRWPADVRSAAVRVVRMDGRLVRAHENDPRDAQFCRSMCDAMATEYNLLLCANCYCCWWWRRWCRDPECLRSKNSSHPLCWNGLMLVAVVVALWSVHVLNWQCHGDVSMVENSRRRYWRRQCRDAVQHATEWAIAIHWVMVFGAMVADLVHQPISQIRPDLPAAVVDLCTTLFHSFVSLSLSPVISSKTQK